MPRIGVDADTFKIRASWEHCAQSIKKILSTEIGSRVQRRLFGSNQERMIDRPQNLETIIDVCSIVSEALEPRIVEGVQYGEPGFVLIRVSVDASTSGKVIILLSGVFFENGHLGDYKNPVEQSLNYDITNSIAA